MSLSLAIAPFILIVADAACSFSFRPALPGAVYRFPADHGSHDDFRTEWWYFTGHVATKTGERYGYELAFFRSGAADAAVRRNPSRWSPKNIIFAHFAVSDLNKKKFYYDEKVGRAALGIAGAEKGRLHVWIGDWSADMTGETIHLRSASDLFAVDLHMKPSKPVAVHGRNGISRKGAGRGNASHYTSLTRLDTQGTFRVNGGSSAVTGSSWMDHEFGSGQLSLDQVGWDWFSIQLDDGRDIMLYRIRRSDGGTDPHSAGSWIDRDGRVTLLRRDRFEIVPTGTWKSPASGASYPSGWTVRIPDRRLVFMIMPDIPDQELITEKSTGVTYWEGSVTIDGSADGRPVRGTGYVELTGYAGRFGQDL